MNALDPEALDSIQIGAPSSMKLIEKSYILAHVADTASACASAFRREYAGNSVSGQDRLHRALAESEDLAAAFRQELAGIEREARRPGLLRHHQGDAQRSFAVELLVLGESRQCFLQILGH